MEDKFLEAQYPKNSREKEIGEIIAFLKKGDCVQIVSTPGAGRSTLLGLLAYNMHVREHHFHHEKEQYHFVMVEFSEIHNKPSIEALKLILLDLVSSLEDRPLDNTYEKSKDILKESLLLNDELVLFQALKKILDMIALEKGLTVVLLFDQFDSYIPMLTSDFFTKLRSLRSHTKDKVRIVFSLYKPLEYLLEPQLFSDFSEYVTGNIVYLSLLDTPTLDFQLEHIEKNTGKHIQKQVRQDLIRLTAGHSKLTKVGTQAILANEPTGGLTDFLLSQNRVFAALSDIWQSLNPAEQTHFLKNLFPSVLDDEHSLYLQNVGLMANDSISLPLFAAFIEKKKEEHIDMPQPITFDETTRGIQKGNVVISDKLTATEFRLLQFFLQHPNTILERNSIISGVWSENKTVLGVTDQALDQLIFRLRRKIEEDPNSPAHLQTVKGRGFRFAP